MATIPLFFFLALFTFVNGCSSDEGWILYMINGKEQQYKTTLRYGTNPNGFGVQAVSESGAYKMSEEVFNSHEFTEVMATNTVSCNSWVKIEKVDGSTITASEAFAVDMIGTILQVTRDDGSVKTLPPWSSGHRYHGPFYHDIFGCGWAWMWTDHLGEDDLRKGSLFGCSAPTNYAWIWYGRGPTHSPTKTPIFPTVKPTMQETYSYVVTTDLTGVVENLLQEMETSLKHISKSIKGRLDKMEDRLNDLEKSIGDLISECLVDDGSADSDESDEIEA